MTALGYCDHENCKMTVDIDEHSHDNLEWLDKQITHVLRDIYPLDVFPRDVNGDTQQRHVAGIYHGMHILRREARELSAREDLEFLPEETEEYYKK